MPPSFLRPLRALVAGSSALAALVLSAPARAQSESAFYPIAQKDPDPIPYGWIGATAGLSPIFVQRTRVGDEPSARDVEGDSTGVGTLEIEYQYPFARLFHGRAFIRYTAWETELSELGGFDAKDLFDFGLAPVITAPSARGRMYAFPYVYFPISLTLSSVSSPPRDEVEENWGTGIGYRIGIGAGLFTKPKGNMGFLANAEWAVQSFEHTVTYHAVDGDAPDQSLEVGYLITWLVLSVGIAYTP